MLHLASREGQTPSLARVALRRRINPFLFGAALSFAVMPGTLSAQTAADVAGWDALVVSPVGALPPRARDGLFGDAIPTELSVRYGRWRYDLDDGIHNAIGFTYAQPFGPGRTSVGVSLAFLSLSCGNCGSWLSGGLDAKTELVQRRLAGDSDRAVTASAGLRTSVGGGHFIGDGSASALSIAGAGTFGLAFPSVWSSRISVSLMPGVGIGRFSSVDETAVGTRPMLGGAFAWALPSGVIIDVTAQRIFIADGPTQLGAGLSWRIR